MQLNIDEQINHLEFAIESCLASNNCEYPDKNTCCM